MSPAANDNPNYILPPGSRQAVGLTGPMTPPPIINEPMPIVLPAGDGLTTARARGSLSSFSAGTAKWDTIEDPTGGWVDSGGGRWSAPVRGQYQLDYFIQTSADEEYVLSVSGDNGDYNGSSSPYTIQVPSAHATGPHPYIASVQMGLVYSVEDISIDEFQLNYSLAKPGSGTPPTNGSAINGQIYITLIGAY